VRSGFFLGFGIVLAFLFFTAATASAASKQSRERAARKACLSGDYNKGMDILSDLFVETQDAIYIFNQGRCLEQNQQYKDAIARFQEFLRTDAVRKLKPEDKASAENHIVACKQSLAEQVALTPVSPPPVVVTPPPAPAPEPAPVIISQPETRPTDANPGSGLRITGIVLASVGVAALGVGLGLNLLANKKISDMESKPDGYTDSKNSSHNTYVTLTWVGYGVGAACLATGAILYGVGLSARSKSSSQVSVVPTFGMGQAGAAFAGAF
jgi:hypothetical protein